MGLKILPQPMMKTPSLNDLDETKIKPGDFMVDLHGIHTMVYIGNKTWIQADPNTLKVIKVTVPSTISWFNIPAQLVQWKY